MRRDYIVYINSSGETYEELYNTFEIIIILTISCLKKSFYIEKIERCDFVE